MSHYVKVIMGNICVTLTSLSKVKHIFDIHLFLFKTLTSLSKVKHIFGHASLCKRIALCLLGWPNNPCADAGSYVIGGPKLKRGFF